MSSTQTGNIATCNWFWQEAGPYTGTVNEVPVPHAVPLTPSWNAECESQESRGQYGARGLEAGAYTNAKRGHTVVILSIMETMKLVIICRLSLVMLKVRSTLPNPLHDPVLVQHARVL